MKYLLTIFSFICVFSISFSQRINLGPNINSPLSEFSPVISPDGSMIFFSQLNEENKDSDIWYSKMDEKGNWSQKIKLGTELNNPSYNSVCGVTADNNTLLLFGGYSCISCSFSSAKRTNTGWSEPMALKFKTRLFLDKGSSFYGCISSNGKVIILEMKDRHTYGSNDLYVSFKEDGEFWSYPINLGPDINTSSWEMTPCIAPDMKTLYFSSDRPGGLGEPDVYVSRRLDDTWLNWSEPENLGPEINTNGWDYYYYVSASGGYAYYSSVGDGQNGNTDIFKVLLPEKYKPTPTVLITGKVLNKLDKKPISANITYETLLKKGNSTILTTDPNDGSYSIVIPQGEKYGFYASREGYYPLSENIDLTKLDKCKTIEKNLYLVPISVGEILPLNNLFFDINKSIIKPESFDELDRLTNILKDDTKRIVEISGHTDNTGSKALNDSLSKSRAESVKNYLIKKGIMAKRISTMGYGSGKPNASNDTEEGRLLNRRVEVKILQ